MTRKMTVGAAAAAFFGTILAASATSVAGVAWNAETTNAWFDAEIANIATGTAKENLLPGDGWENPTSGDAWATNRTVVFDTEVSDPLKYNPVDSGPVALVNVQMIVDPNASMPAVTGLESAQAALSVVTNESGYLEWVGLTKTNNSVLAWVSLSGDLPTVGATYDVQIAVDNHSDTKRIRYAVKASNASTYANLTYGGKEWLDNPQSGKSSVEKVAFAGAGTIKSLDGDNVVEVPAVVTSTTDVPGYDFTNGMVTAVVSVPSGEYANKTVRLKVKDPNGTERTLDAKAVDADHLTLQWDISGSLPTGLTEGGAYSYTVEILTNGVVCGTAKSGTFVAANWLDDGDYWFAAYSNGKLTNGTFVGAENDATRWNVVTNAQFTVTDISDGVGKVMHVDTSYTFETFIDTESLDRLTDAVGGIVAVSNDASASSWYAFTGSNAGSAVNGWETLAGGVVPAVNTPYVVRAEFDFMSNTRRVRYFVKLDGGSDFSPLTLNGGDWINLVGNSNRLSSVGMSGKGSVASIYATLASTAVAKVGDVKYETLWDAVKNASGGAVTLLTNATLAPSGVTGGKYLFSLTGGFDYRFDKSGLTGTWKVVQKGDVLYLMKPAATYIFF